MTEPDPDLIGHYRIERVLGVGGMGTVYLAHDPRLGRQVALKVIAAQLSSSAEFRVRFQREAAVLARLDSPHVIPIFEHGEAEGRPYLVTQFAQGGDLSAQIASHGALPTRLAVTACAHVAAALTDAHAVGVVHRDVKPANVLLRDDRLERPHAYLADFGVALDSQESLATGAELTVAGVAGSWDYLAPERASGGPGTPATDIYAVGCLLWECLTGAPPYVGSSPTVAIAHRSAPVPQLPGTDATAVAANAIVVRCLAKRPEDRYPDARTLRDDLRELVQLQTRPPGPSLLPTAAAKRGPRRTALVAAGVAGLGAALVVTGFVALGDEDPADRPTAGQSTTDAQSSLPAPVTGDINGDGFGDVALVGEPGTQAMLLPSDGSSLGAPETLPGAAQPAILGDADSDGTLDLLDLTIAPPDLIVSAQLTAGGRRQSLLLIPTEPYPDDVDPMTGDVTGDGRDDLVAVIEQAGSLEVLVSPGQPDGQFPPFQQWLSGPLDVNEDTRLDWLFGDVDGDGLSEIVLHSRDYEQPDTLSVFEVEGESFVRSDTTTSTGGDLPGIWRAGDFDGDGVDEIGYVDGSSGASVWEYDGDEFDSEPWFIPDVALGLRYASVIDFDGDGDDDWALVQTDLGGSPDETLATALLEADGRRFVSQDQEPVVPEGFPRGSLDAVEFEGY